jgi:ATP-binding cassette subfamily A (ABC1) protein 3
MDPVAKRFMWSAISRVASERSGTSIILTTHSMEEVEALCHRVGIMVGGRLRCLGSISHLRERHGKGWTLEVSLLPPPAALLQESLLLLGGALAGAAGTGAASAAGTGPDAQAPVQRAALGPLLAALGHAEREAWVSEKGSGWALHAAWEASPAVPLGRLAQWWGEEELYHRLLGAVGGAFPGAEAVERQGSKCTFRLPGSGLRVSEVFQRAEGLRAQGALAVGAFTLAQTTLETIFNGFAGSQEEEKGVARGVGAAAVGAAAVGAATAGPAGSPAASIPGSPPLATH